MELRNIVEIKRRQRIARAALPKLEGAPLRDHLTSDEAGALREVVQKDLPALVEDKERLAVEVRRRFRQTDPAAYDWYFGWIGEQENRGRSRRQPGSAAGRIIIGGELRFVLPAAIQTYNVRCVTNRRSFCILRTILTA